MLLVFCLIHVIITKVITAGVLISSPIIFESYEGTGRSLSLKLLQQLEEKSQMSAKSLESSLSGMLPGFRTYFLPFLFLPFCFRCLDVSVFFSLSV